MESMPFTLSIDQAKVIRSQHGTPVYVYSEAALRARAAEALAFPHSFGLTVRYAMKAAPSAFILRLFHNLGLHFDASSGYEVRRLLMLGIPGDRISLSTQELPEDFPELYKLGVSVNACSLHQLERFGKALPGGRVGLRFNPGQGSGGTNRTNVGGVASSFGIWHEYAATAQEIVQKYQLQVFRIHTHIGSGSDPAVWLKVALLSLNMVRLFPDVTVLNMGGGYKVARMPGEKSTDLQTVGAPVRDSIADFASETGRKLHFEIEPGTYLLATSAGVLSTIQDMADTGPQGYAFVKLDTGMTEILRPSLYGAQHPIEVFSSLPNTRTRDYIVVGHCCESGDILTPAPGDPEMLAPRSLPEPAIGDLCWIGGAGAYCAAMPAKNYNSFPEAAEVVLLQSGATKLIRRRQSLQQIMQNEILD
ncbi:MAG: diaminopimelate decarboxylase [Verrucomicrobia bacterium]|nr:diaminopimelate decarboxylase [Verrucomicrobiota bacterium]